MIPETGKTVNAPQTTTRPLTGSEYLESLRDGREDSIGTEFGARHELYEINYSGSTEENRVTCLNIANATRTQRADERSRRKVHG